MSDDPLKPLDYATPANRRPVSGLKWLLFAGAAFFSFVAIAGRGSDGAGVGATAAGLWIAFALLHVNEQKDYRQQ